jgi:hypothetical protein
MPLHMQRTRFDPADELARVRESKGVSRVVTPFGTPAYLVTRYDDVRAVLADSTRFCNASAAFPPTARSSAKTRSRRGGPVSCWLSTLRSTPGCGGC